jgi:hypothetical protein
MLSKKKQSNRDKKRKKGELVCAAANGLCSM